MLASILGGVQLSTALTEVAVRLAPTVGVIDQESEMTVDLGIRRTLPSKSATSASCVSGLRVASACHGNHDRMRTSPKRNRSKARHSATAARVGRVSRIAACASNQSCTCVP